MEYEATVRAGLAQRQLRSYNDAIKLATLSAEEPPAMPEQALAAPHLHRDWGSPRPHLHRDWAHPCPHRRRDWAHGHHICAGTGLTPERPARPE